uniref:hypothetical protein n=1 Tax=Aliarcobacter sp. TaxID=2321116 RepID=UPI004047858B
MAQKKFSLSQTVNANGVIKKVYANITCEESEIDTVLNMLEGEWTVMIEHKSGGSDATVASYNLLERVTFRAEGKANMSGAIFASNGGLVIKNGLSQDEITDVIALLHPFIDDATKKPAYESIKPIVKAGARVNP